MTWRSLHALQVAKPVPSHLHLISLVVRFESSTLSNQNQHLILCPSFWITCFAFYLFVQCITTSKFIRLLAHLMIKCETNSWNSVLEKWFHMEWYQEDHPRWSRKGTCTVRNFGSSPFSSRSQLFGSNQTTPCQVEDENQAPKRHNFSWSNISSWHRLLQQQPLLCIIGRSGILVWWLIDFWIWFLGDLWCQKWFVRPWRDW